ncbi:hypothetical protein PR048_007156 [Dryococelus australis]|uniref:Uncharacterized protein n=1 Tax=Dryococelus australis TaxID=614101 RepID=A0ABQ9IDF4_9NEOP|nr:hypothetical protein PR048_007156 [Dryococelus australis]
MIHRDAECKDGTHQAFSASLFVAHDAGRVLVLWGALVVQDRHLRHAREALIAVHEAAEAHPVVADTVVRLQHEKKEEKAEKKKEEKKKRERKRKIRGKGRGNGREKEENKEEKNKEEKTEEKKEEGRERERERERERTHLLDDEGCGGLADVLSEGFIQERQQGHVPAEAVDEYVARLVVGEAVVMVDELLHPHLGHPVYDLHQVLGQVVVVHISMRVLLPWDTHHEAAVCTVRPLAACTPPTLQVCAGRVGVVLVAEGGVWQDRTLRDEGHAIHVGCASLVMTMPVHRRALLGHVVLHVYHHVVALAHLPTSTHCMSPTSLHANTLLTPAQLSKSRGLQLSRSIKYSHDDILRFPSTCSLSSASETEKRWSHKDDTATLIKCATAAKCKALNWLAVFSYGVLLWKTGRNTDLDGRSGHLAVDDYYGPAVAVGGYAVDPVAVCDVVAAVVARLAHCHVPLDDEGVATGHGRRSFHALAGTHVTSSCNTHSYLFSTLQSYITYNFFDALVKVPSQGAVARRTEGGSARVRSHEAPNLELRALTAARESNPSLHHPHRPYTHIQHRGCICHLKSTVNKKRLHHGTPYLKTFYPDTSDAMTRVCIDPCCKISIYKVRGQKFENYRQTRYENHARQFRTVSVEATALLMHVAVSPLLLPSFPAIRRSSLVADVEAAYKLSYEELSGAAGAVMKRGVVDTRGIAGLVSARLRSGALCLRCSPHRSQMTTERASGRAKD